MTRIATGDGWRSALLDLMSAQARQSSAQERFTTGKTADDLKGFGRGAESLIAMRGLQDRVRSFIEAGEAAAARLETQSLSLDQLADAAKNTRQAILGALANDSKKNKKISITGLRIWTVNDIHALSSISMRLKTLKLTSGAMKRFLAKQP